MATVTVRNLEEAVVQGLKERAVSNGRSMEAEIREILAGAVANRTWMRDWLDFAATQSVDLELPSRTVPREIDYFS